MGLTPPCPLSQGDLKRYLRAQRPPEGLSPELPPRDLRTLQRMGLEIARGLAHLHSHNYVHRWQPGSHRAELGRGDRARVLRREGGLRELGWTQNGGRPKLRGGRGGVRSGGRSREGAGLAREAGSQKVGRCRGGGGVKAGEEE